MGLKKPSTGGGLPSDVVDYSGKQATFSASTTDYDGTNIRLHSTPKEKTLLDTASTVTATAPLSSFGDATAADVAAGKTFTSAAGVKVAGAGVIPPFNSASIVEKISINYGETGSFSTEIDPNNIYIVSGYYFNSGVTSDDFGYPMALCLNGTLIRLQSITAITISMSNNIVSITVPSSANTKRYELAKIT